MLNVIKHAARHCLCPSPFDNLCAKCTDYPRIKEQYPKEIARAIDESLVLLDNYNHVVLLLRGYTILQCSRGNFAVHEQEET